MTWDSIQKSIDNCTSCRGDYTGVVPTRPPAPLARAPLFLTEAPPESGGFWHDSDPPDRLRRVLFTLLRDLRPEFETLSFGRQGRAAFQQKLFLIQTLKWPLDRSAGSLSPQARKAIRHSVEAHLAQEIYEIRPRGIFASGAAAGLACCLLAPCSGLCEFFSARAFEEEVVGSRIEADFPCMGRIPVYFSHLLVDRFQNRIKGHMRKFLDEMLGTP
jgi:hypothetical protein